MTRKKMNSDFAYQQGFANHFQSEALSGALPIGQNSPQHPPNGLYAEQLSGSAFTASRQEQLRSWLYRIQPSVVQGSFQACDFPAMQTAPLTQACVIPNPLRWSPLADADEAMDFLQGLFTIAAFGHVTTHQGGAMHWYAANQSMDKTFVYNADGEWLFIPQSGALQLNTEFGQMLLAPGEIGVVPRGVKFQVVLADNRARGYVCENYGLPFRLPERGPIGANGLANERDFCAPVASFVDKQGDYLLYNKFQGHWWQATLPYHPLNVVAWHGNYVPYKYDLSRFNTMNSVSYDHADPSIFTVLTSPSLHAGVANLDFVIFPARWQVAEDTFRPPYFHRNIMNEFMGLIKGAYDAKGDGFVPGGCSIHNCMSAHGPDKQSYEQATHASQEPQYMRDTLAFMLESNSVWQTTQQAFNLPTLQKNYTDCWQALTAHFQS